MSVFAWTESTICLILWFSSINADIVAFKSETFGSRISRYRASSSSGFAEAEVVNPISCAGSGIKLYGILVRPAVPLGLRV